MLFRPFATDDLDALYAISLATGHVGADASHLYVDKRMMGHIYAAPYALHDPDLALVADYQGIVAGFVVGTADTVLWEKKLECDWWPALRRRYDDPVFGSPDTWTADQRRAFMIHHPAQTPLAIATAYPAHLHLNLMPSLQHRGVGTRLFEAWMAIAGTKGIAAMHVGVNRANLAAIRFWRKQGFHELEPEGVPHGRTLWMGRRQEAGAIPAERAGGH